MPLQSTDNIHGVDSLPPRVLYIGHSITNHNLQESFPSILPFFCGQGWSSEPVVESWKNSRTRVTYALTMSPVAMSLEELIPSRHLECHIYAILIRTALVISTLLVALIVPFFGLVMSLIGSSLTMLVTLILPCACFLRILSGKVTRSQVAICVVIMLVGGVSLAFGTYSAVSKIIENLR
ncbi:hypothetical protein Nepgr_012385 [Nepenthes gracilis]|uniref:Amino acid transporter transmembrane domain-containing protein n=1 Tax=Nepenthes gracilis TaxID=150966 RepID=A0AAD3XN31_NEPGR|nr:hypothetical protein Nepgr_012385 [Nepenthes gracilis]